MTKRKQKNTISIRSSVIIYFTVAIISTVIIIGNIVFTSWISSTIEITQKTARDINYEIIYQINNYLDTSEIINESYYNIIENNIVDMEESDKRNPLLSGIIQNYSQYIDSFSYATEKGELYGVLKVKNDFELYKCDSSTEGRILYYSYDKEEGTKWIRSNGNRYDPRKSEWYMAGKHSTHSSYLAIHKHPILEDLTISIVHPIRNEDGSVRGVISSDVLLSRIDEYFESLTKSNKGIAIIFEEETGYVIADSTKEKNYAHRVGGSLERSSIFDVSNSHIKEVYDYMKNHSEPNALITTTEDNFYVNLSRYQGGGLNWIVLSAIPSDTFLKDIYKNLKTVGYSVIVAVMVALVVYYIGARKLVKPIKTLLEASERFSSGDLSQRVKIVRDDEIGKISSAFNAMADKMYHLVHNLEIKVKERTLELEKANDALNKTQEELYLILDSTAEGIFGIDLKGKCTFCNNSCIALLGYEKQGDLLGKRMHDLVQGKDKDGNVISYEQGKFYRTLTTGEKAHVADEVYWKADGSSMEVEYYSYPKYKNGKIIGAVITFMDITERIKTEAQIRYLSCHDTLTGLKNRSYLEEALVSHDKLEKLPISIIFADLNGLKLVNDVFGHATGDNLIKRAGTILQKSCRSSDIVARVGGDEFIVLLPNTESDIAQQIVDRIKLELMKETVNEVRCSMALGFDTKTSSYQDIEKIMVNAESEMYKEKLNLRRSFAQDTISNLIRSLQKKSIKEKAHSETVAKLCRNMGIALGLPENEVKKLSEAGYLHDIGKVAIKDEILTKQDLDEHEKQQMHLHPIIGYRILNLFDETLDLAPGIYGHHEKWDGTGYPKGLKGQEIPMISRIISLVESYERRIARYNQPDSQQAQDIVFQELRDDAGTIFDPELVEKFILMMKSMEED